ncbi:hypothetical protein ACFE04_007387 [Oxalis oulophora]
MEGQAIGHVLPGLTFLAIGLWHLFNQIKIHILHLKVYSSSPWFPTSKLRYLELILIIIGSSTSIAFELFITPSRHQPLDPDFTIPSTHLKNFEHATISLSFNVYAIFSIILDKFGAKYRYRLSIFLASIAFSIEFLIFHFHSTDHMGIEGRYHFLLQCLIVLSLATTVLAVGFRRSFIISFVRSVSIIFQGVWLIVTGYMLWTPEFIPKGCCMNKEDGIIVVRCSSDVALHRAKGLVNLQFCWYTIGVAVLVLCFYFGMVKAYEGHHGETKYSSLTKDNNNKHIDEETKLQISEKQSWFDSIIN